MSEEVKAKIRKYNNDIKICGIGVILLSIWTMIRFFLTIYFSHISMTDFFDLPKEITNAEIIITFIFFWTIMAIILLIHFIIGMSAIRYSMGKTKKWGFLIFIFLFAISDCSSVVFFFVPGEVNTNDTKIASILLDITSFYIYFDMIYAVIRVNMIRRKQRKG